LIVVVAEKRLLPTIAALCDVVRHSRNNDSRYSAHCRSLAKIADAVKN
jgi:hypothetical protein